MNDCIWKALGMCDGRCKCDNYMSLNSDEDHELMERYEEEVEPILKEAVKVFAKRNGFNPPDEHKYTALDIETGEPVKGYYWSNEGGNHFIRVTEKEEEYKGMNLKKCVCEDVEISIKTLERL